MKKLYTLAAVLVAVASHSQVVISQVYGGGGNGGSTYTHDFVELYNRGTVAVTLTGHTLQYASSGGAFNPENIQTLPEITIQPGHYFLIQQAKGTGGTTALPTPDLVPTEADNVVVLSIAGANGKIALASNNTAVTASNDTNVVDFVGFGTANLFEGTAAAPAASNSTSVHRANNGCQDTNDNAADFTAGEVTPRNSATAANVCGTNSSEQFNINAVSVVPNPLSGNVLSIVSGSNAEKAVTIFDLLGKQVFAGNTANSTVNVNLTAGVYIVKITEEGKTATRKLVVK